MKVYESEPLVIAIAKITPINLLAQQKKGVYEAPGEVGARQTMANDTAFARHS